MDKQVEQDDGRKRGGQEAELQERIWKEWACLQHAEVFVLSDSTTCPYLKLAGLHRHIKASLSSDQPKSEKQKSRTLCWGSLAQLYYTLLITFWNLTPLSECPR